MLKRGKYNSIKELTNSMQVFKEKSDMTSTLISEKIQHIHRKISYLTYLSNELCEAGSRLKNSIADFKKIK